MKKIDPVQIKMIHVAVGQLGLSDDTYRDILHGHYKAESCKDLSYSQASALIDHFKTLGFRIKSVGRAPRARRSSARNVTFLPSPVQLQLLNDLAAQVTWKFDDGFTRWLTKYIKTDKVRTSAQAQRAIEGLKGLLMNQNKKGHCEPSLDRRGNLNGDIRD